jgi:archaemetzincin
MKVLIIISFLFSCVVHAQHEDLLARSKAIYDEKLPQPYQKLKILHPKLSPIQPGDWLESHKEEGQSVAAYIKNRRTRPNAKQKFIYIQRIGEFTPEHSKILDSTKDYMSLCFGVPVKELAVYPDKQIPAKAQRIHPSWGMKQFYTTYLLEQVLKKRKPADALCVIGFTATDLYPDPNWNFVFGIARPWDGLGLWSIYRNGDPSKSDVAYQLCLRRTIHTAIHETGHLFNIMHCIAFDCVMNGSNSREESDRRELYFCPSCLYKLCNNMKLDPRKRFENLAKFCTLQSLKKEADFFKKSLTLSK